MTQQIGKISVTSSQKSVRTVSVDTVTVRGTTTDQNKKVQSIQYGIRAQDKLIAGMSDVVFSESSENAVITYDANTQIFTVQTLPEIDGGFF